MYAYIKGTLIQNQPGWAVIDSSGIGYKILVPVTLFSQLPPLGSELQLYTSFIVREQSQALYGFLSDADRSLFDVLLTVSGIGPKSALNVIGHVALPQLKQAVRHEDVSLLTRIPGIGKKSAERLIIEMRDKLNDILPPDPSHHAVPSSGRDSRSQTINDAMNALINLGYNQNTAQKALKKSLKDLSEDASLSDLITHTLKNIS